MELKQLSHAHISGIKKWSNITQVQDKPQQYIAQHQSSNGTQIVLLHCNELNDKQKPITCAKIHDKYGKHLKMCEIDQNGTILSFVLENGNIIKCSINNDDDTHIIPSVPVELPSKKNPYECLKVSECGESLLVSLKDTKPLNISNVWIYDQNIQKWCNTEYLIEIEDPFKSYKYYKDSWYIMCIGSDTAMSFEINISIHVLSVITNDEMSETSNEDVSVSTNCNISIDLSEYKSYLTNRIHKILWDLPNKLIVLLFDEFIIWIYIQNNIAMKPLYVLSSMPRTQNIQNMKFRDIIFILNGMMIAVVTNHGSVLFYQRLSQHPILFNYHQMNTKQNILKIDWKHQQNNTFKLHSLYHSNLFLVNNGRSFIKYELEHFKFIYMTSNPLAFIRNNRCIEQYINEDITHDEWVLIRSILLFKIQNILKSDTDNKLFMDCLKWFICDQSKHKIWEWIFIDVLKHSKALLKQQNMLKIITIYNKCFSSISKCLEITINKVYDQMIDIIRSENAMDILQFNVKDLFCSQHKLYDIMILILFEDRSQIIINHQIGNLIDILWRISKINVLRHHKSPILLSFDSINIEKDCISTRSTFQKLRKWLDLQLIATNIEDEMIQIINNDTANENRMSETMNKEEFATLFWKKCSENQQYLMANSSKTDCNIIDTLVDILTSNIIDFPKSRIKKVPLLSIYCEGKKKEFYDSEIEIETSDHETETSDHETEEKIDILTPKKYIEIEIEIDHETEEKIDTLTPKKQLIVAKSKSVTPLSTPIQTSTPQMTSTTQPTSNTPVPNVITSMVTSYNSISEDLLSLSIESTQNNSNETNVNNADVNELEDPINTEKENDVKEEHIEDQNDVKENDVNISEIKTNANNQKVKLQDIAPYVSQRYIIDHLANRLTKQELMELFARKVEITQRQHTQENNATQKTAKWKLLQYDEYNQIIPQQQMSSRLKKKIKKYLRKKNKLMRMEQKRMRTDVDTENAESNDDQEMKYNKIENEEHDNKQDILETEFDSFAPKPNDITSLPIINKHNDDDIHENQDTVQNQKHEELKEINEEQEIYEKKEEVTSNHNLTTAITNNVSVIANKNKYVLTMDTFDCVHIAPSKTIETQTSAADFILDTKYIPSKNDDHRKKLNNWFVAPLLSSPKHIKPDTVGTTHPHEHRSQPINNEHKESEMQTIEEVSEFVPIPIIGARTAGISYIDPSIKINENSLMLKFPATYNYEELDEIKENQETQNGPQTKANSLLQSQCSMMMMHTVNNSVNLNNGVLQHDTVNLNDFQHDIALMDAQIANLSSLCNNIQNSYYTINERLDGNQEINNNLVEMKRSENDEQIESMEAWSLLQNIQQNLDSIDHELVAMDTIKSNDKIIINRRKNTRTHQLRKLKQKTKTRKKRRTELAKDLKQQTTLLNEIYNNLS